MPIIDPKSGISLVLQDSGISPKASSGTDIKSKLDDSGLSLDNLLNRVADIIENSENRSLAYKAIEASLKMHGALREGAVAPPSVTIVINDPHSNFSVNPILIPRPQKEITL